jgi:hypothetical protein
MNLNFGYVALYDMSRSMTKVVMILSCRFFDYDLCMFYARLSLMLFIASLMNFSLSTSAPKGFALLSSTSGRMDVILGCALIYVLDFILCRSLKFKSRKII